MKYAIFAPGAGYRTTEPTTAPRGPNRHWSYDINYATSLFDTVSGPKGVVQALVEGQAEHMLGVQIRRLEVVDVPTFKDLGAL